MLFLITLLYSVLRVNVFVNIKLLIILLMMTCQFDTVPNNPVKPFLLNPLCVCVQGELGDKKGLVPKNFVEDPSSYVSC